MSSSARARTFAGHAIAGRSVIVAAIALGATACSADIGRFDFPVMGYNGSSQQTTGSVPPPPLPSAPMRQNAGVPPLPPSAIQPPPAADTASVAPLPGIPGRPVAAAPLAPAHGSVAAPPGAAAPLAGGQSIEVQQGDSIYAIAKRHGVSINELMSANALTNPTIRPGQRLVVPATRRPVARTIAKKGDVPFGSAPLAAAPVAKAPKTETAAAAPPPAPSNWTSSYAMQPGDSLYAVARRHRVPLARLQEVNGITEPTKVRPGHLLKVPASQTASAEAPPGKAQAPVQAPMQAPAAAATPAPAPKVAKQPQRPVAKQPPVPTGSAPAKVTILNPGTSGAVGAKTDAPPAATGDGAAPGVVPPLPGAGPGAGKTEAKRVASLGPEAKAAGGQPATATDASPTGGPLAATGTPKFRWPVKGRVLAGFGPRPNSGQNDGINIAVQNGAEVMASEAGVVAYAGSELKGYGNLVLIRHDGNWVTAYAHNDQILVKRGDRVRAGQPIAKAGRSGTVDQPQVHFEIRQGSRPVDPLPLLEKQ